MKCHLHSIAWSCFYWFFRHSSLQIYQCMVPQNHIHILHAKSFPVMDMWLPCSFTHPWQHVCKYCYKHYKQENHSAIILSFWQDSLPTPDFWCTYIYFHQARHKGGFLLHLLVFPFVHQFNSRIGVSVQLSYAND